MPKKSRKDKPPKRPRSPFAGRPKSGSGYHSETKYGKKDRRRAREKLKKEAGPEAPGRKDE